MPRDDQNEKGKGIAPASSGMRPQIVHRNPKGNPIRTAWNQVERERRAKELLVFKHDRETWKPTTTA
jgi:hypothetical protein